MGYIVGILLLVFVLFCISNFHVFTAYTADSEKAYSKFYEWKKNYEKVMNKEIILIDIKQFASYIEFYYKTKQKKK